MKFGVGVEGPSDLIFWKKVLAKHFPGHRFDVRSLNGITKLVRETPKLIEQFKNAHYDGVFILLDRDKAACLEEVRALFQEAERAACRLPRGERFLNICMSIRDLEAWFLADERAIHVTLPGTDYTAPSSTHAMGKGTIKQLLAALHGNLVAYNEIQFAKDMAPLFDPAAARLHSTSFNYFWTRLEEVTA